MAGPSRADLVIHTRKPLKGWKDGGRLVTSSEYLEQRGCGGFGDEQKEGCEGHFSLQEEWIQVERSK